MNETQEGKKDKGIVKKYLAKKYDQMLDTILVAAEDQIALKPKQALSIENDADPAVKLSLMDVESSGTLEHTADSQEENSSSISNKEFLQHVASTFLNTSIDQIRINKDVKKDIQSAAETQGDVPNKSTAQQERFVDLFFERLLSRMITDKLPEREHLTDLPQGKFNKPISPAILASNLGKMTGQMNGIFEFQDSLIRLLTWKNPSGTIITILIITLIIYHPSYIILLPLTYIAYGLIIANFNKKYKLRNTTYHLKKTYGKSLLKKIASGGKTSKAIVKKPIMEQLNDSIEDIADWEDTNTGLQVITNLRDLQNMTTNTLHLTDSINIFINETATFKDEKKTTILFLKCVSGYILLKILSPWVNWRLLFSSLVWMLFLSFHPKLRPKLRKLRSKFKNSTSPEKEVIVKTSKPDKIIIDPSPLTREIELFEIYRKGLIPGEWKFFLYSTNVFDYNDECRKAQKPPPGVKELEEVKPPKTWEFDTNSKWEIDYNVMTWSLQKGLSITSEIDNEFYCDNMFKRRRLIRRVLKL